LSMMNRTDAMPAAKQWCSETASSKRWLCGGYIFVAVFVLSRLLYLASGTIELSEDEAYQWLWSKHLAWSYFSKPPLIAYAQFVGTSIWGDNEFGVRFMSPMLAALLSVIMLRFLAAEASARAGFWLIVILSATPLTAVGATLLTVDSLSVFFWVVSMVSGWRAVQTGLVRHWAATGLWLGLGFLSKYTALFQLLSWVLFFVVWPPARAQLRRSGPYVALGIVAVSLLPVLWWNGQHGWITLTHLSDRGGLNQPWRFQPRFIAEFLGAEAGLLNPVFFVAMLWALAASWSPARRQPLTLYLIAMGAPVFVCYLLFTLRARVLPNWIAPAVVPLFALMVIHWEQRWQSGVRAVKRWLVAGLAIGFTAVGLLHATELLKPLTGAYLPAKMDPLHRVRGWKDVAKMLENERQKVLAEGKPVFFIMDHYGTTSELTFYHPEARLHVHADPLVYYVRTERPNNQFFFWPGYQDRKGQSALYVVESKTPQPPRPSVITDFRSVTYLGDREALYFGRPGRRFQLYLCRDLR
jgi:4-amino-4-deoxy-L-arabinose transferase-like glycosyltransferase